MSLFGGFFGDLGDDPFFGGHMQHMNRMMDPFDMLGGFPGFGGRSRSSGALMPFGGGFPDVNSIMENFMGGMGMAMNNGDCHSFSQSTVMTMSSGPDGRPQIYQESQSLRTAPGGVKETKKAVCDSRTGTKRLAIGRHIGERGHVREKVHNLQSGEQEENEDFINLEEDEADQFNREWQVRARDLAGHGHAALGYRDRSDRIERRARSPLPAITAGRSHYRPSTTISSRRPALLYNSGNIDDEDEDINIVAERPRKRARDVEERTNKKTYKQSRKHTKPKDNSVQSQN